MIPFWISVAVLVLVLIAAIAAFFSASLSLRWIRHELEPPVDVWDRDRQILNAMAKSPNREPVWPERDQVVFTAMKSSERLR